MSVQAISWVLDLDKSEHQINPSDVLVLIGLANHADRYGRDSFPSVDTLVEYTGLSERTVRTATGRLEDAGLIGPGDPALRNAMIGRGDRRPKVWNLAMERGAAVAGRGERGATSDTNGVQPVQERGAVVAPEPSLNRPTEPSKAQPAADAPDVEEQFEQFWKVYPPTNGYMRDKKGALREWRKLDLDERRDAYRGAKNKAAHFEATGEEPPYALRFLRRRDFLDYQQPVKVDKATGQVRTIDTTPTCVHCQQAVDAHDDGMCDNGRAEAA